MRQVILVDDNPLVVRSLTETVDWAKCNCKLAGTAVNGEEGLHLVLRSQPDIVLVDIKMPGMDGLTMMQRLKMHADYEPLCIFITSYPDFHYVHSALMLGAFNYIMKPVDNDELERVLREAVAKLNSFQLRDESIAYEIAVSRQRQTLIESNFSLLAGRLLEDVMRPVADEKALKERAQRLEISVCLPILLAPRAAGNDMFEALGRVLAASGGTRAALWKAHRFAVLVFFPVAAVYGRTEAEHDAKEIIRKAMLSDEDFRMTPGVRQESVVQLFSAIEMLKPHLLLSDDQAQLMRKLGINLDQCSPLVRRALLYLGRHMNGRPGLADVAQDVALSPNYLSALVHKETGRRFSDLVLDMKMEHAKSLLCDPTIKIYEVADLLGYDEYTYFYQVFKKSVGISPKEYRDTNA